MIIKERYQIFGDNIW